LIQDESLEVELFSADLQRCYYKERCTHRSAKTAEVFWSDILGCGRSRTVIVPFKGSGVSASIHGTCRLLNRLRITLLDHVRIVYSEQP